MLLLTNPLLGLFALAGVDAPVAINITPPVVVVPRRAGKYATEHAGAVADLRQAGTATVFTRETPGTYDPITDTFTDTIDTLIPVVAMEVAGKPDEYIASSLNLATMPTLLCAPLAYPLQAHTPEFVLPGDLVTWNGVRLTARAMFPLAPDGNVILARTVVGV